MAPHQQWSRPVLFSRMRPVVTTPNVDEPALRRSDQPRLAPPHPANLFLGLGVINMGSNLWLPMESRRVNSRFPGQFRNGAALGHGTATCFFFYCFFFFFLATTAATCPTCCMAIGRAQYRPTAVFAWRPCRVGCRCSPSRPTTYPRGFNGLSGGESANGSNQVPELKKKSPSFHCKWIGRGVKFCRAGVHSPRASETCAASLPRVMV